MPPGLFQVSKVSIQGLTLRQAEDENQALLAAMLVLPQEVFLA